MASDPETVVFDFDGVLVAHDSTGDLVRRRLLERPVRLAAALPALLLLPVGRFVPAAHRVASRLLIRLSGLARDDRVEETLAAFGRSLAHRPGWRVDDAVDAVRSHLRAGDRVLVASASLETCVRAYLDEVDLGEVTVLGSRLPSGDDPGVHLYHAEKVRSAERLGWSRPWGRVYSDSLRDLPMFAVARHVTLVNVDTRTVRRVAARVDAEVDRVVWR